MKKVLLIHNIATSYYKNIVFNEFFKLYNNFKVIHLAETENIRDWKIDLTDIEYPYSVLAQGSMNDYSKWFFIKKIWKTLNDERPNIIYIGGYFHIAYWVALLWAKIYKARVILEMDSNKFDHVREPKKEFIKKFFIKQCDVGMTYGELSKSYFLELGMPIKNIIIKPNVSSRTLFYTDSSLEKPRCMIHEKYFIYVGRFSKEKNLIFLLESFQEAFTKTNAEHWGLLLVGSGPQEDELQKYVKVNNIKNVVFSGFVDKKDLVCYYNHATVFVLPSIREPWGLVVNEAMMCGLPVVVSSQCGCSLDLVDGNGYIFDPFNNSQLVSIFIRYMTNQENILKQRTKSVSIVESFTPETAAQCISKAVSLCYNGVEA